MTTPRNKRGCPTCDGIDPKSCLRCRGKTRLSDWNDELPSPVKEDTMTAPTPRTDAVPTEGDRIKRLRQWACQALLRQPGASIIERTVAEDLQYLEAKHERDLAAREAELARVKEQADKFKWQVRDTCQRAERAEAERDAAVFAINNHNKDCKASCEEQRSRNSCGFASYYPKKNCPNCPEDWAIDAHERALAEIREVWAGSECGEPVYAQEAYAIRLCKQMYQIACDALSGKAPVAPDEVNRLSVRCESQRLKIDAQDARIKRLEEALREWEQLRVSAINCDWHTFDDIINRAREALK